MPLLTLLSWNIKTIGAAKIGDEYIPPNVLTQQQMALIQTIAQAINEIDPEIVSILEVSKGTAGRFQQLFLQAVQNVTGENWDVLTVDSEKRDMYFVAYKTGRGFDVLRDAANNPIMGLAHKDVNGKYLNFSSTAVGNPGRWPAYFAFRANNNRVFTVITYHACKGGNNQNNGIINIANIAPVTQVKVDGVDVNVDVSIVSGDYNVDYPNNPGAYANVTNTKRGWADPPAVAVNDDDPRQSETSLKYVDPRLPAPTSLDFRSFAYDNIFVHGAEINYGAIVDVIQDFVNPSAPGEDLTAYQTCAGGFDIKTMNGRLKYNTKVGQIQTFPPTTVTDAWRVYFRAVSDHLPVWASIDV